MPRILFAVLNWGLGHATRSIPVIRALHNEGAEVVLASDGDALQVLKRAFPTLELRELPGYNIRYGRKNSLVAIYSQVPHVIRTVAQEHRILREWHHNAPFDGVVSDSRFGMWLSGIPSAFIGHQIAVLPPKPFEAFHLTAYRVHKQIIRPFSDWWLPDDPNLRLAGDLLHRFPLPKQTSKHAPRVDWIGVLSRFADEPKSLGFIDKRLEVNEPFVAAVLSGPEPQRTMFQEALIEVAPQLPLPLWIVEGRPDKQGFGHYQNVLTIPFLDGADLQHLLRTAKVVISRSGYSSLMDYVVLGISGLVLVPTPGQTEQEHLGEKWKTNNRAVVCQQHNLKHLPEYIEQANKCADLEFDPALLSQTVQRWLDRCKAVRQV